MGVQQSQQSMEPVLGGKTGLRFNYMLDEFEAKYVQRIKETPFSSCIIYSTSPPLFIDPVGQTLADRMVAIRAKRTLIFEREIVRMISNVVAGLIEIQEKGYAAHGDVSLKTIYFCKPSNIYKLIHPFFCVFKGTSSAFSPEQILAFRQEADEPEKMESDIFSLGVVVTEVCTFLPARQIYEANMKFILHNELSHRLKFIRNHYSKDLVALMEHCLEYDCKKRITLEQLSDSILRMAKITF